MSELQQAGGTDGFWMEGQSGGRKGVKYGSRFLALVSWWVGDGSTFDLDAPKEKQ